MLPAVPGGPPMSTRWVTFDCFGTLVDWHTGFASVLRPIAGDRLPELLAAYHRHEREAEVERPHRLYRDVLESALRRGGGPIGLPPTGEAAAGPPPDRGPPPGLPAVGPTPARPPPPVCPSGVPP